MSPAPGPLLLQATRQVTKASAEFYGPDRVKFLGPFSGNTPSYLNGARRVAGGRAAAACSELQVCRWLSMWAPG